MDYFVKVGLIEHVFNKIKYLIMPSEKNNFTSQFLQSKTLLYVVVLVLVLKITTVLIPINFPQNIFFADITKIALENFTNQARSSAGLSPLVENQKLNQAAQLKAENMVQNQYFEHTSPSGISPWFWFSKAGYNYKYAGENLAIGFFDSEEVYQAWLNSPSHKANILNPNYTEVGTAVLSGFGQNNTIIVVQEFASPLPVKSVLVKNSTAKPSVVPVKTIIPQKTPEVKTTTNTNEKVLSQSTVSKTSILPAQDAGTEKISSKFISAAFFSDFLQDIIYGISLVVIGILVTLILFNFKINFKKELVFRAVLIIVLLSAAALINKDVIVGLIPHRVLI